MNPEHEVENSDGETANTTRHFKFNRRKKRTQLAISFLSLLATARLNTVYESFIIIKIYGNDERTINGKETHFMFWGFSDLGI